MSRPAAIAMSPVAEQAQRDRGHQCRRSPRRRSPTAAASPRPRRRTRRSRHASAGSRASMLPPSCAIPRHSAAPCWEAIAKVAPSSSQRLRVPSSIAPSRARPAPNRDRDQVLTAIEDQGPGDRSPPYGARPRSAGSSGVKLAARTLAHGVEGGRGHVRAQRPERIIPAPTVSLVDSSIRMKLPVVRLREYGSTTSGALAAQVHAADLVEPELGRRRGRARAS